MRPDRCLWEGMNDYLSKPVDLLRLGEVLAKWLPAPNLDSGTSAGPGSGNGAATQPVFDEGALLDG